MRFGIIFANTGHAVTPEGATKLGSLAEGNGFESLWTVEHVLVPADYQSTYPYSPTGRMPGSEESPIPDPLIWLTWVAATTRTIRLATGILILPQRNPAVLAKELATLDVLSDGRLTLGIGVGWLREEFDALGIPFDDRAALTDEYVEALRALWRQPETTFDGHTVHLNRVKSYPKPIQTGGIPIAVGGHTRAAARRAGRIGDEFFPAVFDVAQLTELIAVMRESAEEMGRDPSAVAVTAGGGTDLDALRRIVDLGVTRFVIPLGADAARWEQQLGTYSEKVISALD